MRVADLLAAGRKWIFYQVFGINDLPGSAEISGRSNENIIVVVDSYNRAFADFRQQK